MRALISFMLSTVNHSLAAVFAFSSAGVSGLSLCVTRIRVFNQASPSRKSLPKLPLIMSLPPPPMMTSAPVVVSMTVVFTGKAAVATGSRLSSSAKPLIRLTFCDFRWLSSTGLPAPAPAPPAAPLRIDAPVNVSLRFQPERPSTESKRSRKVNTACAGKKGIPRSELAATVSPLWLAQSKPNMPLLRVMPTVWIMMSSPDSPS